MSEKPFIILATPAPITNATSEENLGLGYLAAVCRNNGIDVEIVDGWMSGLTTFEIVNYILNIKRRPLFVGFSCYLLNKDIVLEIVKKLRENGFDIPLLAGGFGPTFEPYEFINGGFDYISTCEGEDSILDLCMHFINGTPKLEEISGIYYKDRNVIKANKGKLIEVLDKLPFPSRETMKTAINSNTPVDIISSRGCTGVCKFCSVAAFWRKADGKYYRNRSINNFVDEIEYLVNQGAWFLKFVDDSFIDGNRDEKWCLELCKEIKKRNLNILFRVSMRTNKVTEAILEALCDCGLVSLQLGIENFENDVLIRMGKQARVKDNIAALDIVKRCRDKYGLCLQMGFILFNYDTSLEDIELNFKYLKKYDWAVTRGFTEMYAAVGTPYTEKLINKGVAVPVSFGNYSYEIKDKRARKVYYALKKWHINYVVLYDKIIDPITKPRALKRIGFNEFQALYKKVKDVELEYMEKIIALVKDNADDVEIEKYINDSINKSREWIENTMKSINNLYKKYDLAYNANKNPFIETTGKARD